MLWTLSILASDYIRHTPVCKGILELRTYVQWYVYDVIVIRDVKEVRNYCTYKRKFIGTGIVFIWNYNQFYSQ